MRGLSVVPLLLAGFSLFVHQGAEPTKEIRDAALAELRVRHMNAPSVSRAGQAALSLRAPEASELEVTLFERVDQRLVVYRVAHTASTSPSYFLIAATPSGALVLGGAAAPELLAFVRKTGIRFQNRNEAAFRVAMSLARWVDPYGGREVAFPGQDRTALHDGEFGGVTLDPSTTATLRSIRDTVTTYPDGSRSVRIAAISLVSGYSNNWVPFLYCFQVSPDGVLLAWARASL